MLQHRSHACLVVLIRGTPPSAPKMLPHAARTWFLTIFFGVLVGTGWSTPAPATAAGEAGDGDDVARVLAGWEFREAGNRLGWTPNGHIAQVEVTGRALQGTPIDDDPILLSPVFELPATIDQFVEIRIRSAAGGQGQLFWTHTLEGRYGGFDPKRSLDVTCRGGDQTQVIRLFPFWHTAGKVVRLRLDPPNTGRFSVESIRVLAQDRSPTSTAKAWTFRGTAHHWQAWRDIAHLKPTADQLALATMGSAPLLVSPPISVAADEHSVVSLRMAADAGTAGRILAVSNRRFGGSEATFPLQADGQMHCYHVDVGRLPNWQDEIILLGLQPTNVPDANVAIESITIAEEPSGPPELEVGYFGQADGVCRAGRPAGVVCAVVNQGADAARNVVARLRVSSGTTLRGRAEQELSELHRDLPQQLHWRVVNQRPGPVEIEVEVTAEGLPTLRRTARLDFTPTPQVTPSDYMPEPRPVPSHYEIGAFYFPGWPTMTRWQPITYYPERKPVLGWYDESNPEVVDWQIKWAVEHGISFFMVDWYWCRGHRHLEHWLHEGYKNARFRKYLKWAVMWANHHPPGSHSRDDWREVTQYWIDHYFGMKEYYRIDGKPAVFIWAPRNIRDDVGGSQQAAELYAMSQRLACEAGYEGIFFVAMHSHESAAKALELHREGYHAVTSYHAFERAMQQADSRRFPFEAVVETGPAVWRDQEQRSGKLLSIPLVDTGWASQPWHGREARVIYGRTPELFGRLCRKARRFADENHKSIIAIGPWNEWGEGSYIEPHAQDGFAHLDALREAFCQPGDWPPNLVPVDIGRGPYALPQEPSKTAWHFEAAGDFEGWSPNAYLEAQVADGWLHGTTKGHDPVLQGPGVRFPAARFRALTIRLKADAAAQAQVFWGTTLSRPSESNSIRFELIGDGRFHEYRLKLDAQRSWRGVVTSLRFDPAARDGVAFSIDEIRLE